ncbi:MAG TPA: hypothetical protein VGJ81_22915 [Thermoanaerobaculia bacterium]
MSVIDTTINKVIEYIETQQAVTFRDIEDYMSAEHLRFGTATNPIEVLDLAAYRTGRIDVIYDEQLIKSRHIGANSAPATHPAQAQID